MADSYVCSKARIQCSCGDRISTLTVFPDRTIWLTGEPQANISDHISMRNIAPFGKCHTTAYPATGSATAANHGKLTPMPCVPNTPFPWMGGKNDVLLKGDPALLKSSTCKCVYGGTISFVRDGQVDGTYQELTQEESLSQEELDQEAEVELTPEELLDGLQMALDAAGMFPGAGAIPDLLNACISACRGNWSDAGLSLFAAIPGIGDAAGAVKIAKNGAKIAKKTKKAQGVAKKAVKGELEPMHDALSKGPDRKLAEARAKKFGSKYDPSRTGEYFDTAPDTPTSGKFNRDDFLNKRDQYEQDELAAWNHVQNESQGHTFLSVTAKREPVVPDITKQDIPKGGISPEDALKNQALNTPTVDYKPEPPVKKEPPVVGKKIDYQT